MPGTTMSQHRSRTTDWVIFRRSNLDIFLLPRSKLKIIEEEWWCIFLSFLLFFFLFIFYLVPLHITCGGIYIIGLVLNTYAAMGNLLPLLCPSAHQATQPSNQNRQRFALLPLHVMISTYASGTTRRQAHCVLGTCVNFFPCLPAAEGGLARSFVGPTVCEKAGGGLGYV